MSTREIDALINLVEDPDEGVYLHVRSELESYGEMVLPMLEHYWESHQLGSLFQERIESLIKSIQYQSIYTRLKNWSTQEEADLLEGMLILNRYMYPSFDESELRYKVNALRQDLWLELNDSLTALETVNVMNQVFFKRFGFQMGRDTSDTSHFFLSDILSSRQGNALTLGALYRILAEQNEVPVMGIHLPSQFILCYAFEFKMDLDELFRENPEWELWPPEDVDVLNPTAGREVLFYINPASDGAIMMREEIEEYVTRLKLPLNDKFFEPCSNREIMARLLAGLTHSYMEQNRQDKVRELHALQSIFLEG